MIIISTVSFIIHTLWMNLGCVISFFVLSAWSSWSVRRGKPAIPKYIRILIPLGAYLFFLQLSLPLTATLKASERSPNIQSYAESNASLRHDLDRAEVALDRLKDIIYAMLNLAWMAALIFITNWLVPRMDDRNWIHGGIRPPPGSPTKSKPQSEDPVNR